jgi:hypothetical protein
LLSIYLYAVFVMSPLDDEICTRLLALAHLAIAGSQSFAILDHFDLAVGWNESLV